MSELGQQEACRQPRQHGRSTSHTGQNRCSAEVRERNGLPSRWRTKLSGSLEVFLAPRVLIKEAAADVEILVIAGWQSGPFVLRKPLRESDHSAGRGRWLA